MASKPTLIEYASREAMAARMGDLIEARLARGGALAVSGGSTPEMLYKDLAGRNLDWAAVTIVLVDERWVPADHPRSNEAFVRNAFARASDAKIIGLFNGAASPDAGAGAASKKIREVQKPFDVVVLGMGPDGHTASWFPCADGLEATLNSSDDVCVVTAKKSDVTGDEVDRITLTLSAIHDAGLIILMMTGDKKRATFEDALKPGSIKAMPVRAILRARPDMSVCWAP